MKTVYAIGVFDLLHVGHIKLLERARKQGEYLIVGIVKDEAVKKVKGNTRPIIKDTDRAYIVSRLKCVDEVFLQNEFNPDKSIDWLLDVEKKKIDIIIKGEDQDHINFEYAETRGLEIFRLTRTPDVSTSNIIKKLGDK